MSQELEDVRPFLDEKIRQMARNDNERLSWEVRDGITFRGIEVFLNNRVYQLDTSKVRRARELGRLDDLTTHVIKTMQGKTIMPWNPECYKRQDVVRETSYFLMDVIKQAFGARGKELLEQAWREVQDMSTSDDKLSDVAFFTQLRWRLAQVIATQFKKKEKGK